MSKMMGCFVIFLMVLVLSISPAAAQGIFTVELIVHDDIEDSDTLKFGSAKNATRCIDAALGEYELPPLPPDGVFDARFIDHREEGCLGLGVAINYQSWDTVAVIDTFLLRFQPDGDGGYPITVRWPSGLSQYYNSLVIMDLFDGIIYRVDMLANTFVRVENPAVDRLYIIGEPKVNAVVQNNGVKPKEFALLHNYPNPFNPTTSIKFAIEVTSFTNVTIYDILGREVITLVSQELTPGYYTVTWNGLDERGSQVGSGMYFVRMTAASSIGEQKFSAVQKVLLLK